MLTLTDDDLRRDPQALLDDAHRGQVTLVTTGGQAVMMAVPLVDGAPVPAALLDLAASLYDRELISLGRAARIAGLSYSAMIDELGRRDIATVRYDEKDFAQELGYIATLAGG
jgi:predicted HTH domain antitoxin